MPSPSRADSATEPGYRASSRSRGTAGGDPGGQPVDLVEGHQLGHVPGADLDQHRAHGLHLALGVGRRGVDDVDQEIGLGHHLEGRLEGLDQGGGQLAHEAHGVGQQHGLAARELQAPHPGIEGGEQAVLDEHPGAGEPVQQRRLAGVGVAHQRHGAVAGPGPGLALRAPGGPQLAQLGLELRHAPDQAPAVDLELGLARAPGADAPGLLGQGQAPAPQAGQAVAELGQLDLGLALLGRGVLGEDVEDHRRAVDGGAAEQLLQVAALGRRELVVEHDGVGVDLLATPVAARPPCPCPRRWRGPGRPGAAPPRPPRRHRRCRRAGPARRGGPRSPRCCSTGG